MNNYYQLNIHKFRDQMNNHPQINNRISNRIYKQLTWLNQVIRNKNFLNLKKNYFNQMINH